MSATPQPQPQPDELREFLLVLRRALVMIIHYIDKRYGLPSKY